MIGNLGKKDRDGRQVRIEHRGRNLRASRTGGVALREEVRAGRIGLTANSSHGLRLSSALGPGTQVAMQGGRFVLRGRYGSGPMKFNLSKSGVSASLASGVGRLNLTHPSRSSAKLFGVQVRGNNAAWMNLAAMLVAAVVAMVQLIILAVVALVRVLIWLGAVSWSGVQRLLAWWQARQQAREFEALMAAVQARAERPGETVAGAVPDGDAARLECLASLLAANAATPSESSIDAVRSTVSAPQDWLDQLASAWRVARALFSNRTDASIVEVVLDLDDRCIAAGGRTLEQEEMLGVIAEAGGVRVVGVGGEEGRKGEGGKG